MNCAPLLNPYYADGALAFENGHPITHHHFLSDVAALAELLPEKSTVMNLAEDRYRFLVGFGAALVRGQTTLLPPSRAAGTLSKIARDYGADYCLVDGTERVEHIPSYQIPKDTRYSPSDEKSPLIPIDHPALVVFTSGSTGNPHPHSKTWESLIAIAQAMGTRLRLRIPNPITIVATVPHRHMYGLEVSMILPLQHGLAFQVKRPLFPEDVRSALTEVPSPRMLVTTPLHIRACVIAGLRLPPLECILSATAPLSHSLAKQAETMFQTRVYEVYGFTEAGAVATRRTVAENTWEVLNGVTLHQGSDGCSLQAPYFPGPIHFPDRVSLQGSRRFVLHGRGTDLVKIAGRRGSIRDLNQKLSEIEGVQDGVFVLPDETGSAVTRLTAFVVAPGKAVEHILSALRTVIDPVFLPRPLHLVPTLPRNDTGKLTREALIGLLHEHHTEEGHGT
jgi:acyl-coenzyme A synthetase/AMP-(fatty) acid ligase